MLKCNHPEELLIHFESKLLDKLCLMACRNICLYVANIKCLVCKWTCWRECAAKANVTSHIQGDHVPFWNNPLILINPYVSASTAVLVLKIPYLPAKRYSALCYVRYLHWLKQHELLISTLRHLSFCIVKQHSRKTGRCDVCHKALFNFFLIKFWKPRTVIEQKAAHSRFLILSIQYGLLNYLP